MGKVNNRDLFSFWVEALHSWSIISRSPLTHWDRVVYVLPGGQTRPMQEVGKDWSVLGADRLILESLITPPRWHRHLLLDLDGEGLVRLDQQPLFGLNTFHRMFRIPESWQEPRTLSVEIGRLGLMGQHFDHPQIRELAWCRIDDIAYAAYWDLKVLSEYLRHQTLPEGVVSELARDLEQAVQPIYHLPPDKQAWTKWLTHHADWAETDALWRLLRENKVKGLHNIPRPLLAERIEETHKRLHEVITRLNRNFPVKNGHLQALGHAHIDLAWLWREEETRRKVIRTVATQIYLLESFPEYIFGMSTPAMWKTIEEEEPALFSRMKDLAEQNRIEPLGAFWVEADSQIPDAAAIIRQMIHGLRYFMHHLGVRPVTAFLPDTFGFSEGLPTLLAAAGIRLFFTTKLNWNDTTVFPYKDFWWIGPDGRKVQAHIFGGPEQGYNGTSSLRDIMDGWQEHQKFSGQTGTLLYTYGYGDGGGGPNQDMLERLRRYEQLPGLPEITRGFAAALIRPPDTAFPCYRGELYLEYHRGTLSSQSQVKSQMRRIQEHVRLAEALAAWTRTDWNFHHVWERILVNQFHDILPGSAIHEVYRDVETDLKTLEDMISNAITGSLKTLFPRSAADAISMVAANPSGMTAGTRLVEFRAPYHPEVAVDGEWQRAQKIGPDQYIMALGPMEPLSAVSLAIRACQSPNEEERPQLLHDSYTCQSGPLTVMFVPDGIHQILWEGQSFLREPAGIRAYWHHPDRYDAWELMPGYRNNLCDIQHEPMVVDKAGPFCQVIRLRHRIEHSTIVETYRVDFVHHALNLFVHSQIPDRHLLVRYEIPTDLVTRYATAETMWGTTSHPTVPGSLEESARFEWAAHRFVDLSEGGHFGLALLNNGRYGHSVEEGRIGVTLSTAPLYPDPAADVEPGDVSLCLFPHRGTWREAGVMEQAHAFSAGMWTRTLPTHADERRSLVKGWPANFRIVSLKLAEDGSQDVVMQLGEMFGYRGQASCHVDLPGQSVQQVDVITEQPVPNPGTVHLDPRTRLLTWDYRPYELLVLRWIQSPPTNAVTP